MAARHCLPRVAAGRPQRTTPPHHPPMRDSPEKRPSVSTRAATRVKWLLAYTHEEHGGWRDEGRSTREKKNGPGRLLLAQSHGEDIHTIHDKEDHTHPHIHALPCPRHLSGTGARAARLPAVAPSPHQIKPTVPPPPRAVVRLAGGQSRSGGSSPPCQGPWRAVVTPQPPPPPLPRPSPPGH